MDKQTNALRRKNSMQNKHWRSESGFVKPKVLLCETQLMIYNTVCMKTPNVH